MIRRKKRMQPVIPLASMGDIAFLLIIFFMLTSTFMKDANVKHEPARSPDIEEVKATNVSLSIDHEGVIRLMGTELRPTDVESAVSIVLDGQKSRLVRVTIDKTLEKKQYFPVIKALGKAGATPILTGEIER